MTGRWATARSTSPTLQTTRPGAPRRHRGHHPRTGCGEHRAVPRRKNLRAQHRYHRFRPRVRRGPARRRHRPGGLVGAGGAGTAVAPALLRLGAGHLTVVDLDLTGPPRGRRPDGAAPAGPHRCVVVRQTGGAAAQATASCNATPTGMAQHPGIAFDPALLHPQMWVAVVYRPLDTALRATAGRLPHRSTAATWRAQAVDAFALIAGSAGRGRMSRPISRKLSAKPERPNIIRSRRTIATATAGRPGPHP